MIPIYASSKFAVEGFTESLSYELASQGIFVKIVIPQGGVTSTNFNDRAAAGLNPASIPSDYGPFVQETWKLYLGMIEKMKVGEAVSAEGAAEVIYQAATDAKTTLRYYVGTDTAGLVKARHESKTDDEYMTFARSAFSPKQ
jgi:short-subunit dehydrogenase